LKRQTRTRYFTLFIEGKTKFCFYFSIKWDIVSSVIRDKLSQAEGVPGFSDLSTLIDLFGKPTPLFDRENPPRIAYPQVESVALQYQTDAMPTLIPKPDDKS